MTKILVVLPVHTGDIDLAYKLLSWIGLLDQEVQIAKQHHLLIAADGKLSSDDRLVSLKQIGGEVFRTVRTMIVNLPDDRQGWPKGPNYMLQAISNQISQTTKIPWLLLEPDCVPLNAKWISKIEEDYHDSPKLFLGDTVTGNINGKPMKHMSGVAVYPPNAFAHLGETAFMDQPFDIALAAKLAPRFTDTPLIQHYWGAATPPTFVKQRALTDAAHVVDLSILEAEAVLYHRCKDGSLIQILAEMLLSDRSGAPVQDVVPKSIAAKASPPVQKVSELQPPTDQPLLEEDDAGSAAAAEVAKLIGKTGKKS
jgi:hypothetical protein